MKAYTDLEQSKKLAEILPINTADGFYKAQFDGGKWEYILFVGTEWESGDIFVPAWSLVALLNVIPVTCDYGRHCLALINSNPNGQVDWLCCYEDDNGNMMMECYGDSQVDACVAMIEKLNELKNVAIMNYKHKYKEALELARDYFKANQKIGESEENDMLSDIFPELAEDED